MPLVKFFVDENAVQGLPPGPNVTVQAGVSNLDSGAQPEKQLVLPWLIDPKYSWIKYNCWVEVSLDAGMALHKPLPQRPQPIDTIASAFIGDQAYPSAKTGVNTKSEGRYADIIQRMATSTFRFVLKGYGIRCGYQVPVPGLKSVAGVPATSDARQWTSGNILIGSTGGVPLWYCGWELWYLVSVPPKAQQVPPANLAEHIAADDIVPKAVSVPVTVPDSNAVPALPNQGGGGKKGFFTR